MTKQLVFIGKDNSDEEYYINLKDKKLTGWSFMGLRPETEDNLKYVARDTEPTDFIEMLEWIKPYFDFDQWYDDQEEQWFERHDVQAEYEKDGETYYLGYGSGTDIFEFFKNHKIQTYTDMEIVFEQELNINEEQFKQLLKVMKAYKKDETKGYALFMEWQKDVSEFPSYIDEVKK